MPPLHLSEDVARLNPQLTRAQIAGARAGRSARSGLDLVLNGRRVRSQLEAQAYADIPLIWQDAASIAYEAFSVNLGPTRYTWDFTFYAQNKVGDSRIWAVEVKPARWDTHPSGRAALRSIKQASAFFGDYYRFVGMRWQPDERAWHIDWFVDGEIVDTPYP